MASIERSITEERSDEYHSCIGKIVNVTMALLIERLHILTLNVC